MAKFCTLFSGSSGNCTYIGSSSGGILIDAGVSAKAIATALQSVDIPIESIKGIFITHEHSDHIKGARVAASRHGIPIFATYGTLSAMDSGGHLNEKTTTTVIDKAVEVAGMSVTSFATSHDCSESCGYIINTHDERKIGVCTDLGVLTDEIKSQLSKCDLIMIESNHDVNMLQNGPYPYYLKRRVMSDVGHLSNDVCAYSLPSFLSSGTTRFVLGHLSRENNFPALALATANASLQMCGARENKDYLIKTAPPAVPLKIIV